jgi:hypothetical protein
VLDAYNAGFIRPVAVHHKPRIAAALRAAADQVVPETAPPLIGTPFVRWDAMDEIRAQLLVIAAELEAMPND